MYNWLKLIEGDLQYVIKRGDCSEKKKLDAWHRIYDSYLKEFGINDIYLKYLRKKRIIAKHQYNYIVTDDRFQLTLIELEERELKSIIDRMNGGIKTEEFAVHLGKWFGSPINLRTTTVKEFQYLKQEYGKAHRSE